MKKVTFALLIVMMFLLSATMAKAGKQVTLSHTVTGYSEDANTGTVTIDISLHVLNNGETAYEGLTFMYNPLTIISLEEVIAQVGYLGASQSTDIALSIVTHAPFDQNMLKTHELTWAGAYNNPDVGKAPIDFIAISTAGGGIRTAMRGKQLVTGNGIYKNTLFQMDAITASGY